MADWIKKIKNVLSRLSEGYCHIKTQTYWSDNLMQFRRLTQTWQFLIEKVFIDTKVKPYYFKKYLI